MSNERYNQICRILAAASEVIYIPELPESTYRVCDSLQFNLLGLTKRQIDQFVQRTAKRGLKIQVFGRSDNARYFKNWKYSFDQPPRLDKTEEIISCACDMRLSLSFDKDDINLIGYIIKDVAYGLIREGNERKGCRHSFQDYKNGLTDSFKGLDSVISKYEEWATYYDEEHRKNGWKSLLNYLAYKLSTYLNINSKILDVGCGTGLLGQELSAYGFTKLYGNDISKSSLDIARKLDSYRGLYQAELGQPLMLDSNSFDALVSAGVFTRNQVPLNAFDELIRILKPKCLFSVALRVEDNDSYYKKIEEYYAQNILEEVLRERIRVLRSCEHEIVITRKF